MSIYLIDRINKLVKDNFFTEGCGKKYCDGKYGITNIIKIGLPKDEYRREDLTFIMVSTQCLTCLKQVGFHQHHKKYNKVKNLPSDWKKAMEFFKKKHTGFILGTRHFEMQQDVFDHFCIEVDIEYDEEEEFEGYSREPISDDIRDKVWRRDERKCVECGSKEDLELDHIKPVSRGGKSTYRNLQLLCESCNRSKGSKY